MELFRIKNKTNKYLVPSLILDECVEVMQALYVMPKLGYLAKDKYDDECNLYLVVYTNEHITFQYEDKEIKCRTLYSENLEIIKKSKFYVKDYAYDSVDNNKWRVIGFNYPSIESKKELFFRGEYSKMYTKEEIDSISSVDNLSSSYILDILLKVKSDRSIKVLKQSIKEVFDYDIPDEDIKDRELDLPTFLTIEEEILKINKY